MPSAGATSIATHDSALDVASVTGAAGGNSAAILVRLGSNLTDESRKHVVAGERVSSARAHV
jgi:hypothetical protein